MKGTSLFVKVITSTCAHWETCRCCFLEIEDGENGKKTDLLALSMATKCVKNLSLMVESTNHIYR